MSEPKFDLKPVTEGQPYTFSMTIEVPPVFEVQPFDGLSVEREVWTASEEVVDQELVHLAENFASYEAVDGREVTEDNDMVVFDYAGAIDGVAFEGGTAQGQSLILGGGQFIPVSKSNVGQKIGETFEVNVNFPDEYQAKDLRQSSGVYVYNSGNKDEESTRSWSSAC